MSSSRDPTRRYERPVLGDKSSSSSKRDKGFQFYSGFRGIIGGIWWNETCKRNKGHFVKGGVQVSNMEGVPDVAYDEVKESHYRDDGLIFLPTPFLQIVLSWEGSKLERFGVE